MNAPFVCAERRVEPAWIDYNGHMNMAYYNLVFDQALDQVFDELEERFGFPKKQWKAKFKEHLGRQRKDQNNLSVFLVFGNENINDILNGILMRNDAYPTFNNLCEYVIKKSPAYLTELNRYKRK